MPRVRFTRPAINDFGEIGASIAKDNERVARDFIARLREKCYVIAETPHIGRQRDDYGDDLRQLPDRLPAHPNRDRRYPRAPRRARFAGGSRG